MNRLKASFPRVAPDDLVLVFREAGPGKLPLEWAAIKTESGFEDLHASMPELGSGTLLAGVCGSVAAFLSEKIFPRPMTAGLL